MAEDTAAAAAAPTLEERITALEKAFLSHASPVIVGAEHDGFAALHRWFAAVRDRLIAKPPAVPAPPVESPPKA